MTSYKEAGVDIKLGDNASKMAYKISKKTFSSRRGLKGEALNIDGGFTGAIDMGDYLLVNNCDGVGTKIDIAIEMQNFKGLGNDLLAMTVDDAVASGAEVISITNTFDTNKVKYNEIEEMMNSLSKACINQKIIISGGEIAEMGSTLNNTIWNSNAVGIIKKEKLITGKNIKKGDHIISLKEEGLRSNGFSLARYILKNNNIKFTDKYDKTTTWGEKLLTPSTIYHDAILHILGRFDEDKKATINGIVHVTGGGIYNNFNRILKHDKNLKVEFNNLYPLPNVMKKLQKLGNISDSEIYNTWNCGNGMLIICPETETDIIIKLLKEKNIISQKAGEII